MENEKEIVSEQQRVNFTVEKVRRELSKVEGKTSVIKDDIITVRRNFWEDVTVNLDDAVEAGETATSIRQQADLLAEKEHRHRHMHRDVKKLKKLSEAPYFSRIDFHEDGERNSEQIYLGTSSFIDEETGEFLVYDWRAPISSLYYDYSLGVAKFEAPAGDIKGELLLKRQFIIRNSKIQSMFDTGETIGDELLQEVLGSHSDSKMKTIVATIQREQNKIIRNEKGKFLIVQGAAGSGKTSAALQRIAYLMYKYRDTLEAEDILLFSPNKMFNDYIKNVLPELGEENMQQTTFQQYVKQSLEPIYQVEDLFDQMEEMLTEKNELDTRNRRIMTTYKTSTKYMELLERYISSLHREGMIFKNLEFRGNFVFTAKEISIYFYDLDSSIPIPNRLKLVVERLLRKLKDIEKAEREKEWVDEEIQFLSKDEYQFYYEKLTKQKEFSESTFDDYERESKLLSRYIVKKHLSKIRKQIKKLAFVDIHAIYLRLFQPDKYSLESHSISKEQWDLFCSETVKKIKNYKMPYEDATPYLFLKEKIEGFKVNTKVRYVFLDEAQDYSVFQLHYIMHVFPRARFTILGDFNQAIYTHHTYLDPSARSSLFEKEQTENIELLRSYRSTKEIVEFTSAMIEGGERIIPFNRQGHKPVVKKCKSHNQLAAEIIEVVNSFTSYKSIAVICKSSEECLQAYELLKHKTPVHLMTKESNEFQEGLLIIPAYLAKGIEFDAVMIYNANEDNYGDLSLRKLFYTACTRAMHELYLFYINKMTPFMTSIPEDYYQKECNG
ncbi:RNA polymerase recycling motor HelD [Bacillus weihaiensis]|uniref:Helicase n=1 Tax=Bacillus weihaiensis TaxID=1547283 RepID=A0A1L3MR14_9BACI|nr:RNA polymerase recycling motor HelD [Bacillus weihaiensis]APH04776.1 helicase [Bacillus weihaiensis]